MYHIQQFFVNEANNYGHWVTVDVQYKLSEAIRECDKLTMEAFCARERFYQHQVIQILHKGQN